MIRKIISVFIVLLPVFLCSQTISTENVESLIDDTPQGEIRQNGIGSYGFDDIDYLFNPQNTDKKYLFTVSMVNQLYSSVRYKSVDRDTLGNIVSVVNKREKSNDLTCNHDFSFGFNVLDTKFQFSHYHTKCYYLKYLIAKNAVFQFSASKKIKQNTSITVGAFTNYFLGSVELEYFKQIQFLASINHHFNKWSTYVVFRSQSSNNKLKNSIENRESNITYRGTIAWGLQYKLSPKFKVSLESLNKYLTGSRTNLEVALGFNYKPVSNLETGILYSRYIKYYSVASHLDFSQLQTMILSANYKFKKFTLVADYQVNYCEREEKFSFNPNLRKLINHQVKLRLGVEIF